MVVDEQARNGTTGRASASSPPKLLDSILLDALLDSVYSLICYVVFNAEYDASPADLLVDDALTIIAALVVRPEF